MGVMTSYLRYEEVEVICAFDEMHADIAGMMRKAQHEVEETTLREAERIVFVEPWGMESHRVGRTHADISDDGDATDIGGVLFESRDVYSYRVTIERSPPRAGPRSAR